MTQKVIVYRSQYEQRMDEAWMNGGFEIFLVIMFCAMLAGVTVAVASRLFPKYWRMLRGHRHSHIWLFCIFAGYLYAAHWIANG